MSPGRSDRGSDRRGDGGLPGLIRHIIDALVDAEQEGRPGAGGSGRMGRGHFTTEYGFTGRVGGSRSGGRSSASSGSGGDRDGDDGYLVDARYGDADDEVEIVADLPGVDVDDLAVGIGEGRRELVIGVEDRPVERLRLPWPIADVDSRFRNGVLELRIARGEDE
ncbi:hypothetical protein BRC97_11020 [Halobacteriales archaeon QS_6_71_20]|nr:MAG: hypothetical protein BRC97_11020 [Halobacteriales archaeon QS_6_71_20]